MCLNRDTAGNRETTIAIVLPNVGDVFVGRYELIELLGQGGFAKVFRALDRSMSREVAIKFLSPTDGHYPETVAARFLREAQVFAGLEDPHTITMYDFGAAATGVLFMVFEYIRGEELVAVIRDGRARSPDIVAHILAQLLSALREAHERGIFHRDIKPANVLIYSYAGDPFRVKLIDFGIAKDTSESAASITRTGRVVGTLRYMSPEQLFSQPTGADSDIYSLGLLACELLTGTPAMAGSSNEDIIRQQVSDDPIVVPEACAPAGFRRLIEKMAAKERSERYQSAGEVLAELRLVQRAMRNPTEAPAVVGAAVAVEEDTEVHRRRMLEQEVQGEPPPLRIGIVLVSMLAVLALGGFYVWMNRPTPPSEPPPASVPPRLLEVADRAPAPQKEAADASVVPSANDMDASTSPHDGCGIRTNWSGSGRISIAAGDRTWFVHTPADYDPTKRYPLLLMFHRSWSSAPIMMEETQMEEAADKRGFIIFSFIGGDEGYPWLDADDFDYVARALEHGRSVLCLDPTQIWVLGDGMGGDFAMRLSCLMPVSAIAMTGHGEKIGDAPCLPPTPTPRLRIYGKQDGHVPAAGGSSCVPLLGKFKSASEHDEEWKRVNGCTGSPKRWGPSTGGSCRTWDCTVAPMVTCATDHGHYWPGVEKSVDIPGCSTVPPPVPFPYGETVLSFFEEEGRHLPQ